MPGRKTKNNHYGWQVLPFGTTFSPCCAIYAVQAVKAYHRALKMYCRLFSSPDSKVREAEVRIKGKNYIRPVSRLVVLPPILE